MDARSFSEFRQRKQTSLYERKVRSDLHKSRLACQQLDTAQGHSVPLEEWYWPEELVPSVQEGEEEGEGCEKSGEDDEEVQTEMEVCKLCVCVGGGGVRVMGRGKGCEESAESDVGGGGGGRGGV